MQIVKVHSYKSSRSFRENLKAFLWDLDFENVNYILVASVIPMHLNVSLASPPYSTDKFSYLRTAGSDWMVGELRWISFITTAAKELGGERIQVLFFIFSLLLESYSVLG